MAGTLLSIAFACGVIIAVSHVVNGSFVAPIYDVVANLVSFTCACAASLLLNHLLAATFAAIAIACWLFLAARTYRARRTPRP
ncbi:hypothetical protein [Skermania piniformis]|uniref:Uncharacterized protein n=1 Tax=Skermania pinensis TaxID=39122 RepID=A0ABX8S8F2_9ACTN|nr:hypothetical protein [Skermania piniformis]QXQ14133.1 hypothetical protein KV203_01390 [Skermania piniformis]